MKTKLFIILLSILPMHAWAQTPNYEQQGDELFAQAQYEKAEKKYKAAIEMSGTSSSLQTKKENSSKCASLLSRAKAAEESASTPAGYENASKLYSDLFVIHAIQTYKNKANTLKQKANAIIAQQKKTERERAKTYVNGHRAVDMGLSVRWADCNVGASASDDSGNYYAWGETTTKASYNRQTYKFYSNSTWVLKYCTMSDYGNVDNKLVLDYQDDAASANWGERWSTPTKEQWEELANSSKCTWEWMTTMRVPGYRVTSKITGNSIFIPTTGYLTPAGYQHGEMGLYWTSSLYPNIWKKSYGAAYRFDMRQTSFATGSDSRHNGRAIRAVCK